MKNQTFRVIGSLIVLVLTASQSQAQLAYEPYTFTTLAGMPGGPGSVDGTGNAARFNDPQGVAVDSLGNVYVADADNHTIRKVTPAGLVTTLAGSAGQSGSADGTGSTARFGTSEGGPSGVAVGSVGDVYVADSGNHTIRKVTPRGAVTSLAGPVGHSVAVDSAGNLYGTGDTTIWKMTADGLVTTLAGSVGQDGSADGIGGAAQFSGPVGVAVDGAGNAYVADELNFTIRKITPSGVVTTLAGTAGQAGSADGIGSEPRFGFPTLWNGPTRGPTGVAVDSAGTVYVADTFNSTIRKITPTGVVTTLAGNAWHSGSADGVGSAVRFWFPSGVAVDAAGNIYVVDTDNFTVRKITPSGLVTTLAGSAGQSGFADGTGNTARFGSPRAFDETYQGPSGVAVDSAGNVYVADTYNDTIRKITSAGEVTTLAGSGGQFGSEDGVGKAARFNWPSGVAVDSVGIVYVADTFNYTIRKITADGVVTTLAGNAGNYGTADGTGSSARFYDPQGLAVDTAGNVYTADLDSRNENNTIRKITPAGEVTTLASWAGQNGSAEDTWRVYMFHYTQSVAVDSAGNVYVSEADNTIRKITPAGAVTSLAGISGQAGSADGIGSAAQFSGPVGVAVDSAGNVYVADSGNNTIRKGYPALAIASSGPNFGFSGGQFGFNFTGPAGQLALVEASADLVSWLPVWTNAFPSLAGALHFRDPQSGVYSNRFYRAHTP